MRISPKNLIVLVVTFAAALANAQEEPSYIEEFTCTGGKFGLQLPSNLADVMKMDKVIKETVYEIEKWEGYTTTSKLISFPGLSLAVITFSNDKKRYMVSGAEISDSKWAKISPFSVNESIESVKAKLGKISKKDSSLKLSYGSEDGEVKFFTKNGKTTKITYSCYTG